MISQTGLVYTRRLFRSKRDSNLHSNKNKNLVMFQPRKKNTMSYIRDVLICPLSQSSRGFSSIGWSFASKAPDKSSIIPCEPQQCHCAPLKQLFNCHMGHCALLALLHALPLQFQLDLEMKGRYIFLIQPRSPKKVLWWLVSNITASLTHPLTHG